ncbi:MULTISPECIES: M81 family metallopeptidase [Clostridia]|uniref:M81 family metallopeptidase n=1 Tax=Clostridia TaxID=186801 RepID=UPI000EA2B23C|nr:MULTISPECIES: M81 family metallopeptidase [Clostridia]NBJ70704.1 M81 family peptidase [Roseburia sp. 1XD42-34]RKI76819.1 M81 family peptidase [Clostridium sp. 1xD42-85]
MKILMGHFTIESNEHVVGLTELDSFNLKFDEDLVQAMKVGDIFRKNNIEIIPAIFANGHTASVLSKEGYDYIHNKMLRTVKENLNELDGIYLFLHGASKVEDLPEGSGDRQLLRDIRKLTGPYMPICVVMDPHGNLTEEYVSNMTIGRCYRESPHTDMIETKRKSAYMLVELLKEKKSLKPQYKKLPFVLGGERSVSTDEPMLTINKKLDEIEQDDRILSASFHVGYLRHDNYAAGSGLIIVPSDNKYTEYANEVLDELYSYCVSRYSEFHYHGNTLEVSETLEQSIKNNYDHVVITDSGDNVTSGGIGDNTYLLKEFLAVDNYNNKKLLFAGITDNNLFHKIREKTTNKYFNVQLGTGTDHLSKEIDLTVKIINRGRLQQVFGDTDNFGETITLSIKDKPIDIILLDKSVSFAEMHQFEAANVDIHDYNIIVVKQGYIFPYLKEYCDYSIMALTDGPTNQKTEEIVFKQIMRPMLPFDKLD